MKYNTKINPIIVLLPFFIILASCKQQKTEWQGLIEEVDGVTVVKNPQEPIYSEDVLILEKELSIGESEGPEEYMFSQIRSIEVDEDERIYVLDYKESHVKVFDQNGTYLMTIGSKGEGPGELQIPRSLICTSQKEIVVGGINRISYFTLDGEFLKSVPLGGNRILGVDIDINGNIFGTAIVRDKGVYEIQKFDPELNYLHSYDSSPLPSAVQRQGGGRNPFFSVLRWKLINGDQIVCGYADEGYKIKIYDASGNLVKRIEKDYIPVKITQKDIDERIEDYPPELRKNMNIPKHHPPFTWINSDDEGRIYVLTPEKPIENEGYYFDIFDAEGKYILRVLFRTTPRTIKKNKLYTIEEDEEGFQVVKRYKVNWNL